MVKKVEHATREEININIPLHSMPNTVIKRLKGDYVVPESIIIKDNVYLDIDYTDHGNPKTYPYMPHILGWTKKANGKFHHGHWEKFI